jgi:hypothetical protein
MPRGRWFKHLYEVTWITAIRYAPTIYFDANNLYRMQVQNLLQLLNVAVITPCSFKTPSVAASSSPGRLQTRRSGQWRAQDYGTVYKR